MKEAAKMKNKRITLILKKICYFVFATFLFLFLGGRLWCSVSSPTNYESTQEMLKAPGIIKTVICENDMLYVCYTDAKYVNVFSTDGEFLWAVGVPHFKNAYYEISDSKLYIYGYQAYVYNAKDGSFIETALSEDLGLTFKYDYYVSLSECAVGDYWHDSHNVYRVNEDGLLDTVITSPFWHWFFDSTITILLGFTIGTAVCAIIIYEKIREIILKRKKPKSEKEVKCMLCERVTDRKLYISIRYMQIASSVKAVYTLLTAFLTSHISFLPVLLIPIALHDIVTFGIFIRYGGNITGTDKNRLSFLGLV